MRHVDARSRYATLDGLRGAAALLVLVVHFHSFFHLRPLAHAYLAVDLFFAMSGFVIASAYDNKLASGAMNWRQYVLLRLIRLYPLYFAGLLLGVVALSIRLPASDAPLIVSALPANALMMPTHAAVRTYYPWSGVKPFVYPLDFPAWSLFFELLASIAYGLFFRFLTTKALIAVMCASAIALAVAALTVGVDKGPYWETCYVGFARVGYAFTAGLLLYRFQRPGRRQHNAASIAVVVLAIGLFAVPWPKSVQSAQWLFELLVALAVVPATVWVASQVEPGPRLLPFFAFSGAVSYGIYVLHVPLGFIVQDLAPMTGLLRHPGLVLPPALLLLTWLADRYYDTPVRRALASSTRNWFATHGASATAADASVPR